MPYLKEDTYSSFTTAHCYGKAGQEVTIIEDRGGVLIVESWPNVKFPILPNQLTDEPINNPSATGDDKKETQVAPKKTSAVRRQKRAQPPTGGSPPGGSGQGSLFG